jgi:hypothetical protein
MLINDLASVAKLQIQKSQTISQEHLRLFKKAIQQSRSKRGGEA